MRHSLDPQGLQGLPVTGSSTKFRFDFVARQHADRHTIETIFASNQTIFLNTGLNGLCSNKRPSG